MEKLLKVVSRESDASELFHLIRVKFFSDIVYVEVI